MSTETISQQQPHPAQTMNSTVIKPTTTTDFDRMSSAMKASDLRLFGSTKSFLSSSPNSLNHLIAGRSALKAAQAAFVRDFEKRRSQKDVAFDIDYGYGECSPDNDNDSSPTSPLKKRRKFARRNSKTPQMLMQMNSPLMRELELLSKFGEDEDEAKPDQSESTSDPTVSDPDNALHQNSPEDDDYTLDGGLELAEQLVKQIQSRYNATKEEEKKRNAERSTEDRPSGNE